MGLPESWILVPSTCWNHHGRERWVHGGKADPAHSVEQAEEQHLPQPRIRSLREPAAQLPTLSTAGLETANLQTSRASQQPVGKVRVGSGPHA